MNKDRKELEHVKELDYWFFTYNCPTLDKGHASADENDYEIVRREMTGRKQGYQYVLKIKECAFCEEDHEAVIYEELLGVDEDPDGEVGETEALSRETRARLIRELKR